MVQHSMYKSQKEPTTSLDQISSFNFHPKWWANPSTISHIESDMSRTEKNSSISISGQMYFVLNIGRSLQPTM